MFFAEGEAKEPGDEDPDGPDEEPTVGRQRHVDTEEMTSQPKSYVTPPPSSPTALHDSFPFRPELWVRVCLRLFPHRLAFWCCRIGVQDHSDTVVEGSILL